MNHSVHDAWPVRRQTCGYLPGRRAGSKLYCLATEARVHDRLVLDSAVGESRSLDLFITSMAYSVASVVWTLFLEHNCTGVPRGGLGVSNSHWIFRIFKIVFAKFIVQAPLLYSLNLKFNTGKRKKLYTNFTFLLQLLGDWGTLSPRLCPWTPLVHFCSPDPLSWPPPLEPHPL